MNVKLCCLLVIAFVGCTQSKDPKKEREISLAKMKFHCPMPQDSVFSEKAGDCPKCGMALVPIKKADEAIAQISLEDLLKPTNEFVVSSIGMITLQEKQTNLQIEALGNIAYNTKTAGNISARVSGRIEKLYVRFRYQKIQKGDKVMDLYSPEIMTAQQNLLFLIKNDPTNKGFIESATTKLQQLGMEDKQIQQVISTGIPKLTITVYSNYSGHIHESNIGSGMNREPGTMKDIAQITEELSLKEGMYVNKGLSVFSVYNPADAWVILNVYAASQSLVKLGNKVSVVPETAPDKRFTALIDFIEPFYRKDSKTLTVRISFNNQSLNIPIGSQVKATIYGNNHLAYWLPKEAVLSMGLNQIVFVQVTGGFKAKKIITGITDHDQIQVLSGINIADSVALNAQYLMDSESFIKINN